ncbi:hypothetical protein ACFOW4_17915 [Micromonospora sp. GCM10011542]|uniref:hypothetical protein n=1 Tax=Micromonospora sp. GCM10011542 TaxID=3317337 RepID=UPI003607E3FB
MDAGGDDRLRSAVLVGVALAALAAGGWWWRAAAPTPTAGPAPTPTATPSVRPSVGISLDEALSNSDPESRLTVRMDETGEVIGVEGQGGVSIDPATGMVTDIDGAPGELFYDLDSDGGLPRFPATTWRLRAAITPTTGITRQAAGNDARYLLQYRCTRPGALRVTLGGARTSGPDQADCNGMITTAELHRTGGPIRVTLTVVGANSIDVEAQLVELP